jgi:hypothetical protein
VKTNKISLWVARAVYLSVALIMALGSAVCFGLKIGVAGIFAAVALQSQGFAPCLGPSPASMQSGQMPQAALTIHYNTKFTKNLKSKTPAQRICSRRDMPMQAGQQYRDFMYNALPANTNQATEGVIGSGISLSIPFTTYQLGQWADYTNFSDFVLATTIDPALENVEKEMAYRAGQTVQRLALAQFDFARTVDTSVATYDAATGTTAMTKNVVTQNVGSLRGRNVQPLEGMGRFGTLIHPFFTADLLIDNTNNSYVDILKHTIEGQMALKELPAPGGEEATVISFGGATFLETTILTTTPNFKSSGFTAIRTYMAGEDAVIAVKLERPDKTNIGDGDYRNMKLWRGKYAQGNSNDPAGMIGGGTSYNMVGTWGLPPDVTMRCRCFDFVPQTT